MFPELTDEGGGGGGLVMFSKSRAKLNPSKAPPREEQFVYLAFALMPSSGHLLTGPGVAATNHAVSLDAKT